MPQLFTNNARALLASGIDNVVTSLTVEAAKADLFPTANVGTGSVPSVNNWFKVTLQDAAGNVEIVYVRTRNAGSAVFSNVLRGQEGTTARTFAAGSVVGLRITAADVEGSIAAANNSVQLTGNQTIDGTKTFNSSIVGNLTGNVTGNVTGDVSGNAGSVTNGVYTTGDQTIGGTKTFSTAPVAPTAAAKTSNTAVATNEAVDRLRALLSGVSSGTLTAADRGCLVQTTAGVTIPSGVFAAGDVVTIANTGTGNVTITQGTSLTMHLTASANTGNRTLAQKGVATVIFLSATVAIITGSGLT